MSRLIMKIVSLMPRVLVLNIKYLYQKLQCSKAKFNLVNTDKRIVVKKKDGMHTFFGYYDVSPFNPVTNEIIYLHSQYDNKPAQIVLSTIDGTTEHILATTNAWNWQQGARLRWMPTNDREIVFNDYKNGVYFARVLNVDSGTERRIETPLYDISSDGKWGLSVNFERLQSKRPGYGYSCKGYKEEIYDLGYEGIDLVDLVENKTERLLTYEQISMLKGCESTDFRNNYINHLSFSPSGDKFLFFWLTAANGPHSSNLVVYDRKNKECIVLETKERASHYVWEDENHIICTAYYGIQDCHYYRYEISTRKKTLLCPELLTEDGHPSIYNTNVIITDTYPDLLGFQHLYLINTAQKEKKELISIYSDCRVEGERRTDLHPRIGVNKNIISFDSNESSKRSLYFLFLK